MTTGSAQVYAKKPQALRDEIHRKTGKTPKQLYEERGKRVTDAAVNISP